MAGFVFTSVLWLCSTFVVGMGSEDVLDLRRARHTGTAGEFAVPRQFLQNELERLGLDGEYTLKYNQVMRRSETATMLKSLIPHNCPQLKWINSKQTGNKSKPWYRWVCKTNVLKIT